jgi:hypothetical protein
MGTSRNIHEACGRSEFACRRDVLTWLGDLEDRRISAGRERWAQKVKAAFRAALQIFRTKHLPGSLSEIVT